MARQSQMLSDMRALPHRVMKTSSKIYERRKESLLWESRGGGEGGKWWRAGSGHRQRKKIQNRDKWASWGVILQPRKEGDRFPSRAIFSPVSSSWVGIHSSGCPIGCHFSCQSQKVQKAIHFSHLSSCFPKLVKKKGRKAMFLLLQRDLPLQLFLLCNRGDCTILPAKQHSCPC